MHSSSVLFLYNWNTLPVCLQCFPQNDHILGNDQGTESESYAGFYLDFEFGAEAGLSIYIVGSGSMSLKKNLGFLGPQKWILMQSVK